MISYETIRYIQYSSTFVAHRFHGQPHRLNGPALVVYMPNINYAKYTYYRYGKNVEYPSKLLDWK
jgi:hypothetical protein